MGIIALGMGANKLVEVAAANSVVTPWAGPEVGDRSVAHGTANGLGMASSESRGLVGAQLVIQVSLGSRDKPV